MKAYLKKKFVMSDQGAEDLKQSIISSTLLNISLMLPMFISFLFLKQFSDQYLGIKSVTNFGIIHFVVIIIVAFVLTYLLAINDYKKTFIKFYDESARTRINLAEKLKKLPLAYFDKKDIADLSATIMSDATSLEHLFSHAVPKVYAGIFSTSIMFILLFIFDYRLTLALFWVVPVAYIVFKSSRKSSQQQFKKGFALNREIIDNVQEGIDLAQEIQAYNREDYFIEQINKKYDIEKASKIKIEIGTGTVLNGAFSILKLGVASVALYGAKLFLGGEIELFTYLAFMVVSVLIFNPVSSILVFLAELLFLESILERIKEIEQMPSQTGSQEMPISTYDIVFEKVNFSYQDGQNVLKDVSFTAKQGEVTALVGESGGGKSTATKLMARFWDIDSGKISLGGVDISSIEPETLLEKFSIVFQDVFLFNDSVLENIRLGRKDATDEEVMAVAKIARCEEFIQKLPEGYNTFIGENGEKLSGGERQRLSIARALLKDAPVILLDESTASLDAENETEIQAGISELIKNKTVVIIAHRMRTVIDADKIVVLQDGKIVESGKSQDLINKGGIFAKMYQAQQLDVV